MCSRYTIASKTGTIEEKFNITANYRNFQPVYNVSPGMMVPVITSDEPHKLQLLRFGLIPSYAKKEVFYPEVRIEGNRKEPGKAGIIFNSPYMEHVRSKRCLVPMDSFFTNVLNDKKTPYVVFMRRQERPFLVAGIWDEFKSRDGTVIHSFAIITTMANEVVRQAGCDRMPVIVRERNPALWLNKDNPVTVLSRLVNPYGSQLMNAYPVLPRVKRVEENDLELFTPAGPKVMAEFTQAHLDQAPSRRKWGH